MKIKRPILTGIIALLLLFAAYARFGTIDGFTGIIWGILGSEDTVYAPGYSDSGFRRVTTGMTRHEAYQILGLPLTIWTNKDSISEAWSRSPGDTDYRCRVLIFSNDVVVVKHGEFYLD